MVEDSKKTPAAKKSEAVGPGPVLAVKTAFMRELFAHRKLLQNEVISLSEEIARLEVKASAANLSLETKKELEDRKVVLEQRKKEISDKLANHPKANQDGDFSSQERIEKIRLVLQKLFDTSNWDETSSKLDHYIQGLNPTLATLKTDLTTATATVETLRSWTVAQKELHLAIKEIREKGTISKESLLTPDFDAAMRKMIQTGRVTGRTYNSIKALHTAAVSENASKAEIDALEKALTELHTSVSQEVKARKIELEEAEYQRSSLEKEVKFREGFIKALEQDKRDLAKTIPEHEKAASNKQWRLAALAFAGLGIVISAIVMATAVFAAPITLVATGLAIISFFFLPLVIQLLGELYPVKKGEKQTFFGKILFALAVVLIVPMLLRILGEALGLIKGEKGTLGKKALIFLGAFLLPLALFGALFIYAVPLAIAGIVAAGIFLAFGLVAVLRMAVPLLPKESRGVLAVVLLVVLFAIASFLFAPGALAVAAFFTTAQLIGAIVPLGVAFLTALYLGWSAIYGKEAKEAVISPDASLESDELKAEVGLVDDNAFGDRLNKATEAAASKTKSEAVMGAAPAGAVDYSVLPPKASQKQEVQEAIKSELAQMNQELETHTREQEAELSKLEKEVDAFEQELKATLQQVTAAGNQEAVRATSQLLHRDLPALKRGLQDRRRGLDDYKSIKKAEIADLGSALPRQVNSLDGQKERLTSERKRLQTEHKDNLGPSRANIDGLHSALAGLKMAHASAAMPVAVSQQRRQEQRGWGDDVSGQSSRAGHAGRGREEMHSWARRGQDAQARQAVVDPGFQHAQLEWRENPKTQKKLDEIRREGNGQDVVNLMMDYSNARNPVEGSDIVKARSLEIRTAAFARKDDLPPGLKGQLQVQPDLQPVAAPGPRQGG